MLASPRGSHRLGRKPHRAARSRVAAEPRFTAGLSCVEPAGVRRIPYRAGIRYLELTIASRSGRALAW